MGYFFKFAQFFKEDIIMKKNIFTFLSVCFLNLLHAQTQTKQFY